MMHQKILTIVTLCAISIPIFFYESSMAHAAEAPKKVVLIAGKKSHGPEGNGMHDYPWSVKLLKVMLDNSNVADKVRVEYHLDGWPEDDHTLDDADTIMIISDGRDGDAFEEAPHFSTEAHRQKIAQQIARGCGFLTFHFSTFAPDQFAEDILSWSGGYFDWETDGKKQWYSAIKTLTADVQLGTPNHPVLRGVQPFKIREEFYYNIRFAAEDKSVQPIWIVPAVEGRADHGNVVAWVKERSDGGRGFGTTCGHFYDNWEQPNFRKMILNALLWTAKVEIPVEGVDANYYTHAEITAAFAGKHGAERAVVVERPIKALILTGHQYPGHLWKDTTPALKEALLKDPRIQVEISNEIEDLATEKITLYDLLVLNYCNWEKPGLSDAAKAGFAKYLQNGGGLIIIHFANGAFHFSLPKAGDSDWPEYRKICRRVWDHTPNQSGHDAYGKFVVDIAKDDHPITRGMEPFETTDELYFRQQGEEPIEVLLTAKSKITGQDEPMAFVYRYGQGRVMQTVLGHAAESLRTPGVVELLRRSAAWVADRNPSLAVSQNKKNNKKDASKNAFYHWSKDVVGFNWTENDSRDSRWNQTDVGPFLASIVPMPDQPAVAKGLSIKVGSEEQPASVCFDTQTMGLRSAWTGGFLKFDPARYGIIAAPQMDGELQFLSSPDAGWVAKSVRLMGYFLKQHQLMLEVNVDGVAVSEIPRYSDMTNQQVFCRDLEIGPSPKELRLRVGRFSDTPQQKVIGKWSVLQGTQNGRSQVVAIPKVDSLKWSSDNGDVQLVVPPHDGIVAASLVFFTAENPSAAFFENWESSGLKSSDFERFRTPEKSQAPLELVTSGQLGQETGPYQVDTLTIPFENSANALFFTTGQDFLSNGDIAVCTVHGDVWLVSGADKTLKELHWRRFATGLFQPLGLRVANDVIHVLGRDRITQLYDDNRDGMADRYVNFCDLYETSTGGHDYITCLETDPEGNFYFAHAKHGVQKVSKDGTKLDTVATGLRNPNGLSVSPRGEITAAPQEGEWTPASGIFMVHPGDHFGYTGPKITPERLLGYNPPLCWIPRLMDNSSGGQCWTPEDSFGLPADSLLHFSFGQCKTLFALRENLNGLWQGGVISLPWNFQSGLARGRFNPYDGHLYVTGLKGWTTSAVRDGCLQRVRYVGGDIPWPVKMQTYQNGIAFTFGTPLAKESAENPENYSVQACNYRYAKSYGSPDFRPSHPTVEGRDDWDVASATLLEDQKTVFLEIPDLTPVMQVFVNWSIQGADSSPLKNTFAGTIHHLPDNSFAVPESSRRARPGRLTKAEEDALLPGVYFTLSQAERRAAFSARLLACAFPADEPPAPQLKPGTFSLQAEGYIKAPISGEYRFRVEGSVSAKLIINQQEMSSETPIRLHKGFNLVRLTTGNTSGGSMLLRLMWQSDTFAEEPVPATVWYHNGQDESAIASQRWHHGQELFETFQCARCHLEVQANSAISAPDHAPSLKSLRGRISDRWLAAWLLDPRSLRNRAEMPSLFDGSSASERQAAADVAAYLMSQESDAKHSEPQSTENNHTGDVLFEELGCIACHRFTSPSETDTWHRDSLHFTAEKFSKLSLRDYLRQPQQRHQFTRMPDFHLSDSEVSDLADYIGTHSTGKIDPLPELAKADAERGRDQFLARRCHSCHESGETPHQPVKRIPLPTDTNGLSQGCLAEKPVANHKAPQFPLEKEGRVALQTYIQDTHGSALPMSRLAQSAYLIQRLQCTACHQRDHIPSPRAEIIAEESHRGIPASALPNLSFVGEKLHSAWMRQLFHGDHMQKSRPWISTRMPAFPAYADMLANGLTAEHGVTIEPPPSTSIDADLAEIGRRLTLKDNGLDCRQCHAVAGQQPTGDDKTKIAPGIDFAVSKHRLREDFYRRFVLDPPRFDISIRMPKLAIDGKTTQATGVFEGDARQQFEALWQYVQSLPD